MVKILCTEILRKENNNALRLQMLLEGGKLPGECQLPCLTQSQCQSKSIYEINILSMCCVTKRINLNLNTSDADLYF